MDIPDQTWNDALRQALIGRRPRSESMPEARSGRPMYAFWGEDLGFSAGDVHKDRAYRIYLAFDERGCIADVDTVVEGELISPCSGWFREALDAFDFQAVRDWCLDRTELPEGLL